MTEAMKITLSTQPADARWGEKATYSINNDGITLHLNGADDLGLIQRAARKIDGLGIKHVQLSGEGWDADRCWAFWQGYKAPKGTRKVEWPDLDDAQRQELDNRLMIIDWVRDTINAPAEELGPSQLAQRAVDLISNVASDRVTYRITKGEDLREQGYMGLHTVGRGSERSPVLLALDYNPTGDKEAPVYACLVGKGIARLRRLQHQTDCVYGLDEVGHGRRGNGYRGAGICHYARTEQAREAVPLLCG